MHGIKLHVNTIYWENLVNHLFTKPKPSILVLTNNNPLADLFIHRPILAKCSKKVNSPNLPAII